jgi:hypothetical protein
MRWCKCCKLNKVEVTNRSKIEEIAENKSLSIPTISGYLGNKYTKFNPNKIKSNTDVDKR